MDQILAAQIAEIAKTGLMGALLILAAWRIYRLEGLYAKCQEDRQKDWKEIGDIMTANSVVMTQWTATSETRNRALEASVKAQESSQAALSQIISSVTSLSALTQENQNILHKTREALLQKGVSV